MATYHKVNEKNREREPLRIAVVFPRFTGPFGPERHLLLWTRELAALGQDVTIYTHRFDESCRALLAPTVKLAEIGFPPVRIHVLATLLDLLLMPWLALHVRDKFDVIHGITWQAAVGARLVKTGWRNRKAVVVHWCTEPPRFAYDLLSDTLGTQRRLVRALFTPILVLIRALDKAAVRSADAAICSSEWMRGDVERIYGKRFSVIYPGVETERFQRGNRKEARNQLGISQDKTVFLSVSKLHRRKQIDHAMRIFRDLALSNSVMCVVGDGPDRDALCRIARETAPDSIVFVGKATDDEVALYMSAADYFIFVGKNEPFGMAPVEAALSGCWIISEGTAGFKELIAECVVPPSLPLPEGDPPSLEGKVPGWDAVARKTLDFCRQTLADRGRKGI